MKVIRSKFLSKLLLALIVTSGLAGCGAGVDAPTVHLSAQTAAAPEPQGDLTFPLGTNTPSTACAGCHQTFYREVVLGEGADMQWSSMLSRDKSVLPYTFASLTTPFLGAAPTAHAGAGVDPWPINARNMENGGNSCNVCHYPQPLTFPDLGVASVPAPTPRPKEQEANGITCASCHLTADGKMRGPYDVAAPHATVVDPAIKTSAACAYCHAKGPRVVGKQTQTFLEWREDYFKPGVGTKQCQDCHMPTTTRQLVDNSNLPERVVGRHLWPGGHSFQQLSGALAVTIADNSTSFDIHLKNVGAGHSVPTGSNRRGMHVTADLLDGSGRVVATRDWLFAPSYANRPDDKSFLAQDQTQPDALAASQADAQGPHEASIRAGEDRVLTWNPGVASGGYTLRATVTHDLNRYNDDSFTGDKTVMLQTSKAVNYVAGP